jgi:hypothetical protein
MNLWCPACRKEWPAGRVVCPDCLVELVADPAATVRCRHCGKDWPAAMHSCPECLAELRTDPAAVLEAQGRILGAGGHLYRPDGVAAFAGGPACTLLRLSARGRLAFVGNDGLVEATVDSPDRRAVAPLTCQDHDGSVLFRLVAYEPVGRALVAVAPDGAPLGTYLPIATAGVDVRDETSAPVARLVKRRGRFDLVETGGGVLAGVQRTEVDQDGWIDDQWWLQPEPEARLPLRTLAVVALVLAVKVLLGRPAPGKTPTVDTEPDDEVPWSFS